MFPRLPRVFFRRTQTSEIVFRCFVSFCFSVLVLRALRFLLLGLLCFWVVSLVSFALFWRASFCVLGVLFSGPRPGQPSALGQKPPLGRRRAAGSHLGPQMYISLPSSGRS